MNVLLHPGIAFGTGEHATTRMCLRWLLDNLSHGVTVMDYGCGSGILAVAACKLGASAVVRPPSPPRCITRWLCYAMQNTR
jgi:ribosomal protein L11 methyltransferase